MKAVIPAAGFGTRFLPLTKAQPKEMLPVVNKPTIQWVIEEAVDAGISDIAIIIGEHKDSIQNHFSSSKKLENALEKAGKKVELEKVRKISTENNIVLIFDECTSGFRRNLGGLHLTAGVNPDLAMFGKALGNG